MNRSPWTHEEISQLIPKIAKCIEEAEVASPDIRPLPPMTSTECRDYLLGIVQLAMERPLTSLECFMYGQLLSQFQQANWAEAKGYEGRCYFVTESMLQNLKQDET